MASIFDNVNDEGDFAAPAHQGESFTIQFGVESTTLRLTNGLTVKDAFAQNAAYLGFSLDRRLTYRDNQNNLLTGNEQVVASRIYTASITHDEKGL